MATHTFSACNTVITSQDNTSIDHNPIHQVTCPRGECGRWLHCPPPDVASTARRQSAPPLIIVSNLFVPAGIIPLHTYSFFLLNHLESGRTGRGGAVRWLGGGHISSRIKHSGPPPLRVGDLLSSLPCRNDAHLDQ